MRPKGSAAELERRRRRATALCEEDHSQAEVARRVGASESSVHRWRRAVRRKNGLAAKPHPGRPRRLTAAQHRRLERALRKGATAHGWSNDLWTAARVAVVIKHTFGVSYHVEHVRHILKDRLGWSSQRPEFKARERDEKEIARWVREEFPRIKRGRRAAATTSYSRMRRGLCSRPS
jgi:transposase